MSPLVIFAAKYLIFLLPLSLAYFWFRGEQRLVFKALAAVLLAEVLTLTIGFIIMTPRPFMISGGPPPPIFFVVPETSSFPSAHTAVGVALAVSIWLKKRYWGLPLFLVALFVGGGRVLASAHFWWDILGGAVLGILSSLAVNCVLRRWYHPK